MQSLPVFSVENGQVETDLDDRTRALIERLGRIDHVIRAHRAGIEMQSKRRAEIEAKIAQLERRR